MTQDLWVNDVHSGLNLTKVRRIVTPASSSELVDVVLQAGHCRETIVTSGCRHAMGGQQFAADGVLVDLRQIGRILGFDREKGLLRVEAGIEWPELIAGYLERQTDDGTQWGIVQKQTGADRITLGGSLSANAHGRGLTRPPMIGDVEALTLLKADGTLVPCSRQENAELFALVIGGYGLFGIVIEVVLRLAPRCRVERFVEIAQSNDLHAAFKQRIQDGFVYGDFQFSIDEKSPAFLQMGVFSCYRPTERPAPATPPRELTGLEWMDLLYLAYTDRAEAFEKYATYYMATNGQVYWSDTHQLGPYFPDYAEQISLRSNALIPSSLVITELYVPREQLATFLRDAADLLRNSETPVIYGTVRLIEQDRESFLAWARESYACIIFNLKVDHSEFGKERAARTFRGLIDLALSKGGSYYLTYHRFAGKDRMEKCYPQFGRFLEHKKSHDPEERFQSDWYRHYRDMWSTA
jgi:FAD/FMN-containing dehydrogenase